MEQTLENIIFASIGTFIKEAQEKEKKIGSELWKEMANYVSKDIRESGLKIADEKTETPVILTSGILTYKGVEYTPSSMIKITTLKGAVPLDKVKAVVQFAEECGGWDKMEEILGKK